MSSSLVAKSLLLTLPWLLLVCVTGAQEPSPSPAPAERPASDAAPDKAQAVSLFDGKTLKGWQVIDKNMFEDHGEVEVHDGAIVLGEGKPASGVAYQGELPRVNYELTLQAKRLQGTDFFCGLTFPVGEDYLTLVLGGWGGGVTGVSNLDDMSAVENETTGYTEFEQGRWYNVRLRVTKDAVQAWLDQERIVEVKTAGRKLSIWWEQEPARPLGIVTWNTKGAVRDIKLRKL